MFAVLLKVWNLGGSGIERRSSKIGGKPDLRGRCRRARILVLCSRGHKPVHDWMDPLVWGGVAFGVLHVSGRMGRKVLGLVQTRGLVGVVDLGLVDRCRGLVDALPTRCDEVLVLLLRGGVHQRGLEQQHILQELRE